MHNIIFTKQDNISWYCTGEIWYRYVNNLYNKIFMSLGYNVIIKDFGVTGKFCIENGEYMDTAIAENSDNDIYIFNTLDFASFLKNPVHKEQIYRILDTFKYIVLWQEILKEDLSVIGYDKFTDDDKDFVCRFFGGSKFNIISNLTSIVSLQKNNIHQNIYFPITGYSMINDIVPFVFKNKKDIDVLIYGTMNDAYTHRNSIISKLCEMNINNYNIVVRDNIYGEDLDSMLQRTKIVVHIPSYENLTHMPWPKITYLQARKIFFIIEDNEEIHLMKLDDIVMFYHKNDVADLYAKIDNYLGKPVLREKFILKNYKYIANNFNMDVVLPKLIRSI